MTWDVERMSAEITPPIQGAAIAVNCSTTVQIVDLTTIPSNGLVPNQPDKKNPIGHFVRITAQGGDVHFMFGSNTTTLNTISPTSFTTVAANGKVTVTNNETSLVPSGSWKDFRVVPGVTPQVQKGGAVGGDSPCRYLALVATAGNPVARIEQSSD